MDHVLSQKKKPSDGSNWKILSRNQKIPFPSLHDNSPKSSEEEDTSDCLLDYFARKTAKPLIGCEYLLELMDPKMKEPLYICTLCDKRCDPRNIIPQVTSHGHRMKYLDFHFPKLMAILNKDRQFNADMAYREKVLTSICKKIEAKSGRQKPLVCEYQAYERNKAQLTERLKMLKHFCDKDFPDWEQDLLNGTRESEDELEVISNDDEATHVDNADYRMTREASNAPSISSYRPLSVRELTRQSEKALKDSYSMEKYRITVEKAINRLEIKYKDFEKNPEKHPDYSDEWQAFWQRRYNQLKAQGKDANDHNYKPEWIDFWMPRMRQLKILELEKEKGEIREKMNLNKEAAESFEKKKSSKRDRSASSRRLRSPIEISDEERSRRPSNDRNKRFRRAHSTSTSRYSESPARSRRSRSRENSRRSSSAEVSNDGPINIVTVCRLLLALESELGIIAPRVVALLEQALSHERGKANSSDELLRDLKNINFLDMVKEKLKGLLVSELLGHSRIAPVKKSIRDIAALLHEATKLKPSAPVAVNTIVEKDPSEIIKLELAKTIEKFYVDQGKSAVSDEELSGIIDECMQILSEAYIEEPKVEPRKGEDSLDKFTDEDLISLLRNFSVLTDDEQKHLICYLEKLEKSNPRRVKMLSKYVDAGDEEIEDDAEPNDVEMNVPAQRSNIIQLTGKGKNRRR